MSIWRPLCTLCTLLTLGSQSSQASLGGDVSSIDHDGTALKARAAIRRQSRYTIHELKSSTATVREYAAADGKVFAVSWSGPAEPDLSVLLGDHYDEVLKASQRPKAEGRYRARGGASTITAGEVVVERSGHARAIRGKAYLRSALPSGVNAKELK